MAKKKDTILSLESRSKHRKAEEMQNKTDLHKINQYENESVADLPQSTLSKGQSEAPS